MKLEIARRVAKHASEAMRETMVIYRVRNGQWMHCSKKYFIEYVEQDKSRYSCLTPGSIEVFEPVIETGFTVEQLIVELQKLASAGRNKNRVFVRMDSHDWCPRLDSISTYHTKESGHVVLRGEQFNPESHEG